ncbi:hypothetical protein TcasGA2_TC001388 [Tribolium castaneum]|uniref:HAT C-terminal dimerisation domain-containing protein n=1 Tax=Tribolium castaneum TaxID=7070 RepID=D7EKX1_TRICA|nr:hypothetical protein TcasGA2_TC001388 [Tribolium castaneum]
MLGVVVRYYSFEKYKPVSTYLGLVHLENGTADAIVAAILQLLTDVDLKIEKLCGLGTDNASVMVGVNQGVFQKLRSSYGLDNLVLVRCVCHSLQLAVSAATEESLPRHIEFMIRETYNWFQHSSLRQLTYANIYKVINDGKIPLKVVQLSNTKWLSIEPAIGRILDQYIELKTHFEIVRRTESCYKADMLYTMYCDSSNKVYLIFLHSILVQKVNKESNNTDSFTLQKDLINFVKSLANIVINNFSNRKDIGIFELTEEQIDPYLDPRPYLGFSFEKACEDCNVSPDEKETVGKRCFNFLVKLLKQLVIRLPSNKEIFNQISLFSVQECLKPQRMPITKIAERFIKNPRVGTQIEEQWANLRLTNWQKTENTAEFWGEVMRYKDASGENPFQDLVGLAVRLLILPHSNADVERVFSNMNIVKSKLRNKMSLKTLHNILLIRFAPRHCDSCTCKVEIPPNELKAVGTSAVYKMSEEDPIHNEVEILRDLDPAANRKCN